MCSYSDDNRSVKTLALLLALIALLAFAPSFGSAQKAQKKMSVQDVIDLLTGDVPSDAVAQEAQKAGISFQVTAAVAKQIKDAGGTDDLIQTLRTLAPHTTTPPVATPHPTAPASPPTLVIESSPGQSQVYVDDEPVGTTSQQGRLKLTQLAPGQHNVRISLGGYQDSEQTVTLEAGRVATLAATLQRVEAPPVVTPQPNPEPPINQPEPEPSPRVNQPGYLGIIPSPQQPDGARGVVISGVQPGGPAAQAGLKAFDTILAVNGQQTPTPPDLRTMLSAHQAGDVVQITWYNGTRNITRQVRLATPPAGAQALQQPVQQPNTPPSLRTPRKGVVTFTVAHDHGQSGKEYCAGVMSIGNGMVYYKGVKSTSGPSGIHNYQIPLDTIKEARRNGVYLEAIGAFHIRTRHGTNYNFVVLNAQGQFQPPDQLLDAIENARGK
jgi:hypothetical protein